MNITLKQREIDAITYLKATPVHTAALSRALEINTGNMSVLVQGMCRNGYIEAELKEPESRVGYRHGEKRKVWKVTGTGLMAQALHAAVLHNRATHDQDTSTGT